MKTTFILKKTMVEKGLKNLKQALHIILFTLFLSSLPKVVQDVIGQPIIEWDKTFGGSGGESMPYIIPTSDGGYLLTGTSDSNFSGDKSENSKGEIDYWIVKIDAQGNKIWDKTLGGSGHDNLTSAISTPDGGYLLGGTSDSLASGDKSEDNKGDYDFWIVKTDAEGNKIWDKTFGGSSSEDLRSAISTPEGGYLLAGTSESNASGDKSENSKGGTDYWIVKIDGEGNKIWDKTIGGSGFDGLRSAISTPEGGYLLAGSSNSPASGDKSENPKGGCNPYSCEYDYWIVKIDADGNKVWDKTIGGSGRLNSVISTPEGGYLLAGDSFSYASVDGDESDYWIVKVNSEGNKVWEKTFGGNGFELRNSVISTPEGGYLLAGHSDSSASRDKSEDNKGEYDFWVVKIDADGNKVWDKTLGGSGNDWFSSTISATNGGYLLAGTSVSDASGDKSENSKGGDDYWIVKIKEPNTPVVTSLTLMDAKTDQEVRIRNLKLGSGDVINLAEISSARLNIRANSSGVIDSVKFQLQGPITHTQTERKFPYALFGDDPTGDFKGRKWLPGEYLLTATPYTKDEEGIALTVFFELSDAFALTRFYLRDVSLNKTMGELSDGDVIDLASFNNHRLTIWAVTEPLFLKGKVTFALEGPIAHTQTEQEYPYMLFGDYPTFNSKGMRLTPGAYTLTATPYALDSMGMSSTIHFTVIDSRVPAPEASSLQVKVYPVPTSDILQILHEGKTDQVQLILLDFGGNVLLHQPLRQQLVEQLDLSGFRKGTYYLKVVSPETVQVFRVVVE